MRVLFLYPNHEGYFRVPIGLTLIMTVAANEGHEVDLFDTTFIATGDNLDSKGREKDKLVKAIPMHEMFNKHSQEEIVDACKKLFTEKNKKINVKNFQKKLYTKNVPDPDILIRTGGTKRLSNFLLWQLAYTEIFFIDKLWPDFNENDFNKIISKFHTIKRNFGKI